jgi:transcriptional regulator with GAF, ATPase, and Fis domain
MSLAPHTQDLRDLAQMVGVLAPQQVMDHALASLRALIPCDLIALLRLREGELVVEAALGPLADARVRGHRIELSAFPSVQRALSMRQAVALQAHDHAGDEGDPYDGVLDLDHGHACMVVPLFVGSQDLGVITLDRSECGMYPPGQVALAAVTGQLVSLAIQLSDQAHLLERYRHQLREQNRLLVEDAGHSRAVTQLERSPSPRMQALAAQARQVARSDLPVLLTGQTGTGKEVLARAIHAWSARADSPMVTVNCAAIPENLVESELFGHVRGAFSGAERDRAGRFQTAHGGTLLLDELGELPLRTQATLLRVLQEGSFQPVGSDETVRVDVRVLAATHTDLDAAVAAGRFRQDLLYRLRVFPLELPPLSQRIEEIEPIARGFLRRQARGGRGPWTLPAVTLGALELHPWPGNVRELLNVLERATILVPQGALTVASLGLTPTAPAFVHAATVGTWHDHERAYLGAVLAQCDGKIAGPGGAAELAGLKPTTLRSKLRRFGLL